MPEQTIQCTSACTVTVQHEIALPVLDISTVDGALIASAVLAVWVVGYGFRLLIRAFNVDSFSTTNHED